MIKLAESQVRKEQLNKELKRITKVIIRDYSPLKIILFGSLVSGRIHPYSDIDLAVIKSTRRRFIERMHQIRSLTQPRVGIHFLVYTPQELAAMIKEDRLFLTKEILGKGRVLYERKSLV